MGERESVLAELEEGESLPGAGTPDGTLPDLATISSREEALLVGYGFGLSLPVGPLPSAGLLAGGRCKAARRTLFSSSSSATRCSRACSKAKNEWCGQDGGERKTCLEMGSPASPECSLDVPGAVWREIVVAFAAALGRHGDDGRYGGNGGVDGG